MATLARVLLPGAVVGSALVTASYYGGADGTSIVIHNGDQQLGSAALSGGVAQITLSRPLALDDLLVASVTTQGNLSGPPMRITDAGIQLGSWVSPTEITIIDKNGNPLAMPVTEFAARYGYQPAGVENTSGLTTINYPEFQPPSAYAIAFDLQIERQGGQTTATVQNVQNHRGGVLVRWTNEAFSNNLSKVFTQAGSYQVEVKGSQNTDGERASRLVNVTIQDPPPATPQPDSRIEFMSWFDFGSLIKVHINSSVECQAKCDQSSVNSGWQDAVVYDKPRERECFFDGVPSGSVTITIRVRGETDASKYKTMSFTKF